MGSVIAFVDDLMFLSRIREAARPHDLEVRAPRRLHELLEACRTASARLVLIDIESARLPVMEALAALKADPTTAGLPVVGFYNHVNTELARQAEAAGCSQLLTRGTFVRELGTLLAPRG